MPAEHPPSETGGSLSPRQAQILGEGQEGMEFVSFSRGNTGPLVSQPTGGELDSYFLNWSKNHCYSPSRYAPSLSPFPGGWMPRLERYPPIPLPQGTAGGKAEAGAWEEGLRAGATDHPRCCHPHGAPSPRGPKAYPARAVNWEVGVARKQQFGTGVTS